jgi:NCAIR mutase (PurE)-related protein
MSDRKAIRELLERVASGDVSIDEAMTSLRGLPFEDLEFARLDHHRALRRGFPEVVYCPGKTPEQVAEILERLAGRHDQVLATRATRQHYEAALHRVPELGHDELARAIWLDRAPDRPKDGGVVVVCAGTSDLGIAREAAITLDLMGHASELLTDVGIAGLHRLLPHVQQLQQANVIVVVAGMEGALPSVVAGLVDAAVIAVPTSVGYGASFRGIAPLLGMLNACASGVGVVNIDNGFGAGYLAATINRRIHDASGRERG